MMTFFAWTLVIGMLFLVGLLLRRKWEDQRQAEAAADTVAHAGFVSQLIHNLQNRIAGVRNRFARQPQPDQAVRFRTWVVQAMAADPALTHWLEMLADEQVSALVEHVAAFCREMGFELAWLVEQEVGQNPALERALGEVVALYCRACYQSVNLQGELESYKLLRAYLQNPNLPQNRAFGQALFGKLLAQGATPINVADHMALPERERQQQIFATIQQAATEAQSDKQSALRRLIKEVVIQQSAPAPTTDSPSPASISVATNGTGPHKVAA